MLLLDDNFQDRPRERLWRMGAHALPDRELLGIVLGTGIRDRPAAEVAAHAIRNAGGLHALSRASPHELAQNSGIGHERGARVAAAFELGRRAVAHTAQRASIAGPEDLWRLLAPRFAGLTQEIVVVVGLDVRNRLIDTVEIARGSVASVDIQAREVFRPLLRMAAFAAVLAHNHPSGDPTPSAEDIRLTRQFRQAGELLGVPLVDHVILGDATFCSLCEWMGAGLDDDG